MRVGESHDGLFPLAYLLTWTTYGTWLPGDQRGWTKRRSGRQTGQPILESSSRRSMTSSAQLLDPHQREIVSDAIRSGCLARGWHLHAVNCRSNHVHCVVSAQMTGGRLEGQLKAICSSRLNIEFASTDSDVLMKPEDQRVRWWSQGGDRRRITNEKALERAIIYVLEGQEPRRFPK